MRIVLRLIAIMAALGATRSNPGNHCVLRHAVIGASLAAGKASHPRTDRIHSTGRHVDSANSAGRVYDCRVASYPVAIKQKAQRLLGLFIYAAKPGIRTPRSCEHQAPDDASSVIGQDPNLESSSVFTQEHGTTVLFCERLANPVRH